ncbi:MAG: gyrase inhibitor YacG [Pseudomonadota bacterium]
MCKKQLENAPDDFAPRPFCSPRCKLADLGNWLGETYRVSTPLEEYGFADPATPGEGDFRH